MANTKLKFEDFEGEKLSRNQQKTVRGGDGDAENPAIDPGKNGNSSGGVGG